ncbi:MAG: DUF4403 family protein [Saprospiraceae bacterium]|nr:DUF4403 family protein [Saprospiraceae bacterium]
MQKIVIYASLFLLFSCKSAQLTKPMEHYDRIIEEDRVSVVNIPVRINLRELEKSLNAQLSGVLYEDKDLNDSDKMMLRAEKSEDIRLNVSGQSITYRVPVKLWVKYNIGITNLEATGEIAMNFKTDFSIDREWNMQTLTNIERYEWIKQPKLKMGSLNVPVGFIGDIVLRQSKAIITKSVDEQVKENFNLRELVEDAWQQMFDPVMVSPEYNTWLLVNPQNIGMTPLVSKNESITSVIFMESRPKVMLGTKPQSLKPVSLPPFVMRDTTESDFSVHINTEVPFAEAERMAKAALLGEIFSEGKRSVKIEDLQLYGQGTKLIVNTRLSGSYNGSIYLSGRPFFDASKNAIDIKDLDFTLETRNFLHKSAAWLLKGTLRKRIEENMNFLLDYNLNELKNQLQEQLSNHKIAQNIFLDGNLDELYIRDAFLSPESIRVEVAIKGKLNVQVNGLN